MVRTAMGEVKSAGIAKLERKFSTPDRPPAYSARSYPDGTDRTTFAGGSEQLWRALNGQWHRIK